MGKKKTKDESIENIEKMFPETGLSEYEQNVAKDAGLNPEHIKMAMEEPSTTEEAYAKIMGNLVLSAGDKRKLMSELGPKEIGLFAKSYARAMLFNNTTLTAFLDEMIMLKVSKQRKGRMEVVKLSGAIREQEMKRSLWARIASMGGNRQQGMM